MNLYTPDKKTVDIDALRVLCERYPAIRMDRSTSPKVNSAVELTDNCPYVLARR